MITITYKSTRHLEKHYSLEFLKDYYGDNTIAMTEILRLYLAETPGDLQRIENSLDQNDLFGAKAATHKIKTNIAMLGIHDPADFVGVMQKLQENDLIPEEISVLFRLFKSEVLRGLSDIESDFFSQR